MNQTTLKLGICQIKVEPDKKTNLTNAGKMIHQAKAGGAELIILPEMFNCPYQLDAFDSFAESETNGETIRFLSGIAQSTHCYIIGGSIPERDGDSLFNTAFVFNRYGQIIAKHRKIHLFDIDIPGRIRFQESKVLTAGAQVTSFKTEFGRIGLAICYDLRFPELFRLMVDQGADLMIIPAAFNNTTGPAHWETIFRTRAIDNQVFMIGVGPANNPDASYLDYGHSLVVSPWGDVIWQAGLEEVVKVVEIDLSSVAKIRAELPLLQHRRKDLYQVVTPQE